MTDLAEESGSPLRHPGRLYIGGAWVEPATDATIEVYQPSTEELHFSVPAASRSDMDRAITAARQAFDTGPWPVLSHVERAGYLRKVAAGIRARGDELTRIRTGEMGVLHALARSGTPRFAGVYDYYPGFANSYSFVERH